MKMALFRLSYLNLQQANLKLQLLAKMKFRLYEIQLNLLLEAELFFANRFFLRYRW